MTEKMTTFAMNQLSKKIMDIVDEIDDQLDDIERHSSWDYTGKDIFQTFGITEKQKIESKNWIKTAGRAKILDELVELADEIEKHFNLEETEED